MNKRNGIIIILILGIIGIITVYFKLNTPEPTNFDPKNMQNLMQIKPGESNKNSGDFITKDEYHKNIDKYKNRKLIYFFKTDWCFACKVVSADARANLNLIPSNVVFVELDFDTENELRERYQVTVQTTFVHVDKDGNKINMWRADNIKDALRGIK